MLDFSEKFENTSKFIYDEEKGFYCLKIESNVTECLRNDDYVTMTSLWKRNKDALERYDEFMVAWLSIKSKSKGRTNQSKDLSPDLKIQLFRFYREFNLHLGKFSKSLFQSVVRLPNGRLLYTALSGVGLHQNDASHFIKSEWFRNQSKEIWLD